MKRPYYCKQCGEQYDLDQEPPEGATFYWVPHCPSCNASMTDTPTDSIWIDVVSSSLVRDTTDYETYVDRLNAYARLYHGRLADVTVDELIDRAKWFDDKQKYNDHWFSSDYHKIAFELRKQARKKLKEE
jgi:hypothetical protein